MDAKTVLILLALGGLIVFLFPEAIYVIVAILFLFSGVKLARWII